MSTNQPRLLLYDALAAHTYAVRIFILERGGLTLDVQQTDIASMENRKPAYRADVNARGELPALLVDDSFVLAETTAICEYLDEVTRGGQSLFGATPLERAETRMWLRRMDLEIAQPVVSWYRNDSETVDFYKGNRLPTPGARLSQKIGINQSLNLLDDELEGKTWLCGERFSAADIHFYGLAKLMAMQPAPWVLSETRKNVVAYFKRIGEREASQDAFGLFDARVSVPAKSLGC